MISKPIKKFLLPTIGALTVLCFYSRTDPIKPEYQEEKTVIDTKLIKSLEGPKTIVRTIMQDSDDLIWIASWDGVFRYNGKAFTHVTHDVSDARFFSVLEDRKKNFWFSTIGSGVYYYDGVYFHNYTTKDGLAHNNVTEIYEDKGGNIWFSTAGGASRYDGKKFSNFTQKDGLSGNEVNVIVEDSHGLIWIGTNENASIFDGKSFTTLQENGKPFKNVRSIIEDKNGNMWLGGQDGLWSFRQSSFTQFTEKFVGYVYEDQQGNIWTSSQSDKEKINNYGLKNDQQQGLWTLSRYPAATLFDELVPDVMTTNQSMIFGILEAKDRSIWFGTLDGVYRFEGNKLVL